MRTFEINPQLQNIDLLRRISDFLKAFQILQNQTIVNRIDGLEIH
jgi:hypothetical protein